MIQPEPQPTCQHIGPTQSQSRLCTTARCRHNIAESKASIASCNNKDLTLCAIDNHSIDSTQRHLLLNTCSVANPKQNATTDGNQRANLP